MCTTFWLESLEGGDHSEDLGINRRITLDWSLGKWWEDVDWIHLAEDRD
jgi:hypothetical protein